MGSKPVGISGSRASAILGLNKYQSEFEVWQKIMEERQPGFNAKRGYTMPDDPDNAPIRWGNAFEEAVIELAESEFGGQPILRREKFFSKVVDNFEVTCHIDGQYEDCGHWEELHEGKTTNIFTYNDDWGEPGTDRVPKEYAVQCQHQMICSSAEAVILSVLVFPKRVEEFEADGWMTEISSDGIYRLIKNGEEYNQKDWAEQLCDMGFFHQYRIEAKPSFQKILLDHYRWWWDTHVLKGQPPEPGNYDDVLRMLPEVNGVVRVEDDQVKMFKRYHKQGQVIKRIVTARESNKIDILSTLSNDAEKDESEPARLVFMDQSGNKLGSFNGKQFRVNIKEGKG